MNQAIMEIWTTNLFDTGLIQMFSEKLNSTVFKFNN